MLRFRFVFFVLLFFNAYVQNYVFTFVHNDILNEMSCWNNDRKCFEIEKEIDEEAILSADIVTELLVEENAIVGSGIDVEYDIIKRVIDLYERGNTVFQLGVQDPFLSFEIAKNNYNTVWIMLEDESCEYGVKSSELFDLCKTYSSLPSMILLTKSITPQELIILGRCEHFDLVIANDIVERFGEHYMDAIRAIFTLGDNTIIKISYNDHVQNYKTLENYILEKDAQLIHHISKTVDIVETKFYLLEGCKEVLEIPCWRWHRHLNKFFGKFRIESNYKKKMFYKSRDKKWYQWVRGLNAYTFKILHGVYPTSEMICSCIKCFYHASWHKDCKIWNMIIQGKRNICLIDCDDYRFSCSKRIHKMRIDTAMKIFEFVWYFDYPEIMKIIRRHYKKCKKIRNPLKLFPF